jgi:hypothetical protein
MECAMRMGLWANSKREIFGRKCVDLANLLRLKNRNVAHSMINSPLYRRDMKRLEGRKFSVQCSAKAKVRTKKGREIEEGKFAKVYRKFSIRNPILQGTSIREGILLERKRRLLPSNRKFTVLNGMELK